MNHDECCLLLPGRPVVNNQVEKQILKQALLRAPLKRPVAASLVDSRDHSTRLEFFEKKGKVRTSPSSSAFVFDIATMVTVNSGRYTFSENPGNLANSLGSAGNGTFIVTVRNSMLLNSLAARVWRQTAQKGDTTSCWGLYESILAGEGITISNLGACSGACSADAV